MSTKNLVGASEEVVNERNSLWFHRGSGDLTFGWELLPISAVNFGGFWVNIGEGIFGFRPHPNQFFLFGLQRLYEVLSTLSLSLVS